MGLITAAGASLASVLGDQWKEYFYCSEMDADVLVRKGQHHTGILLYEGWRLWWQLLRDNEELPWFSCLEFAVT